MDKPVLFRYSMPSTLGDFLFFMREPASFSGERPSALLRILGRIPPLAIMTVAAFALAMIGWLMFATMQAESRERMQAERTLDIIWGIRDLNRVVAQAETDQRGYLLTGDRSYLQSSTDRDRARASAMEALRYQIRGITDPALQKNINDIDELSRAKFDELSRTLILFDAGKQDEALAVVRSNKGKDLMDRYRAVRDEIEDNERSAHAAATANAINAERWFKPLALTLVLAALGALALGAWQAISRARAQAEARSMDALQEAHDRTDLLARELNHRVKNLFAIVQSIVRMTARRETDVEVASEKIVDRINALAVAHQVSQGALERPVADLKSLIEATLAPYEQSEGRLAVSGPDVVLPAAKLQPLGLILHELATNAVKYGCWATQDCKLSVDWALTGSNPREITLRWHEDGIKAGPDKAKDGGKEGFGTQMMTASARQLRGKIERRFEGNELIATLVFPLEDQA